MKDQGTRNSGLLSGFSPLAGVSAGTAGVLFAFGVLCLAWHQVSGHVSLAITVLVYVAFGAVCGFAFGAMFYVVLWLRHRVRHPETMAPRQAVRAAVLDAEPQAAGAVPWPAIGPPRVYFTDDQFAALIRQQVTVTQLPRDGNGQGPA